MVKIILLFILLLIISYHSFSQKVKEEEIFTAVEKQAEYPGGMAALGKFLQKNLKYGKPTQEVLYSKIYIKFVVEKDGYITDFTISPKEVSLDSTFLVKFKENKWTPAMLAGKPVRSRFTIPINICLSE